MKVYFAERCEGLCCGELWSGPDFGFPSDPQPDEHWSTYTTRFYGSIVEDEDEARCSSRVFGTGQPRGPI